jgi:hypothetical protein
LGENNYSCRSRTYWDYGENVPTKTLSVATNSRV